MMGRRICFVSVCVVYYIFSFLNIVFASTTDGQTTQILKQVSDDITDFLYGYNQYCTKHFKSPLTSDQSLLCPCVSPGLIGRVNISLLASSEVQGFETDLIDSIFDGTWQPLSCIPRHKVAVIIPFRDREKHLKMLLAIVHAMLKRQLLHYTVFVVEQSYPKIFNKAAIMNAGFTEVSAMDSFDCFVFHDVDMLPEDDRNFYTCSRDPRHVGSFVNKWNYSLPYDGLIGGVIAFRKSHFEMVNGFSNSFYGWGGEDDDMFKRILAKNMSITRFPKTVARYTMIKHHSDEGNPYNSKGAEGFAYRPNYYKTDGLNSLKYKLDKVDVRPLYIWMSISLPPIPSYLARLENTN